MIDIKSLKLGNYVMYEQTTHVVTAISESLIETRWNDCDDYAHFPSELDPISLTEEILLKCGFEKEKGMMSYILDGCPAIKIVYGLSSFWLKLHPHPHKIEYFHSLQNIFFAVTGKELEYEF